MEWVPYTRSIIKAQIRAKGMIILSLKLLAWIPPILLEYQVLPLKMPNQLIQYCKLVISIIQTNRLNDLNQHWIKLELNLQSKMWTTFKRMETALLSNKLHSTSHQFVTIRLQKPIKNSSMNKSLFNPTKPVFLKNSSLTFLPPMSSKVMPTTQPTTSSTYRWKTEWW